MVFYACIHVLQHLHAADSCFIAIDATFFYLSDEELCQGCQKRYTDDSSSDQECWVGCDFYWCADLAAKSDSTLEENTRKHPCTKK